MPLHKSIHANFTTANALMFTKVFSPCVTHTRTSLSTTTVLDSQMSVQQNLTQIVFEICANDHGDSAKCKL